MKNNFTRARTCVYNVHYHIVWSTNNRKKVLNSLVAARLKDILIQQVSKDKDFIIHEIEVGEKDHIHMFVSAHPKISISYMLKKLIVLGHL